MERTATWTHSNRCPRCIPSPTNTYCEDSSVLQTGLSLISTCHFTYSIHFRTIPSHAPPLPVATQSSPQKQKIHPSVKRAVRLDFRSSISLSTLCTRPCRHLPARQSFTVIDVLARQVQSSQSSARLLLNPSRPRTMSRRSANQTMRSRLCSRRHAREHVSCLRSSSATTATTHPLPLPYTPTHLYIHCSPLSSYRRPFNHRQILFSPAIRPLPTIAAPSLADRGRSQHTASAC